MKVTLTQFAFGGDDGNGRDLPMGKGKLGSEMLTADGDFAALEADATFVRVATDTNILMDCEGGSTGDPELIPAGSVEFFAVSGGETFTVATA